MDDLRVTRWAGVLGVVIPSVGLALHPIWAFPGSLVDGAAIASWAAAHHGRLVAMMVTYTVGVTLWMVFGVGVWTALRTNRSAGVALPAWFLGGLIGYVTLLLAGFTAFDLLLYRTREPETARLLYDLTFGLLAMSGMPTAVSLAAFAAAVRCSGVLPRYTGHLALVAAAAHVLLLLAFVVPSGPLSLQGFSIVGIPALLWLWIIVTAVSLPKSPLAS
jgi:hypothetical protein